MSYDSDALKKKSSLISSSLMISYNGTNVIFTISK